LYDLEKVRWDLISKGSLR